VVVDFNGTEGKGEGVKSETDSTSLKVLPPWMITSGMNLTKEQRGEDEYIKAYYAALLKKQHELEEAAKNPQDANAADDPSSSTSIRKVGDKYKHKEDDDGTEWEEAPARGNGIGAYKVDLNVEADAPAEDDEDDIDWEEG
ncbi:general transcription factor IIE subunit, partial [Trifolium pratense]